MNLLTGVSQQPSHDALAVTGKSVLQRGISKRATFAFLSAAVFTTVLTPGELRVNENTDERDMLTFAHQSTGELGPHERSEETNLLDRRKLLRSLPIVLSGPLPGGLGNQLETLYEQIAIVHKNNFEFYFPPAIPREHGNRRIPAEVVWDLTNLRKRLPNLHSEVPATCDSKNGGMWDVRIEPSKERKRVTGNSSQAKTMEVSEYRDETLVFRIPRYGLEDVSNLRQNILDALLRHSKSSLFLKDSKRSAICLWVGIHAAQPDTSFAPLLRPSLRIQRLAKQWPLKSLGVVHLRFDERLCGAGPPPGVDASRHVCVPQVGVYAAKWVPVSDYAQKVSRKLAANGVTTMYLTRSKYVPEGTWKNLENAFRNAKMVKLAESAWEKYDSLTLNFLERELATRSRYFLSEARSSWSRTVTVARLDSASTSEVSDLL